MPETFPARLIRVRLSKFNGFRVMSQEAAARLFHVSISAYRRWEKGKTLPDSRSRLRMAEIWPEVFARE